MKEAVEKRRKMIERKPRNMRSSMRMMEEEQSE